MKFVTVSSENKRKGNINNDLAILSSYDIILVLSFLVPRIITTHNMGQSCCPFCLHLLLSTP